MIHVIPEGQTEEKVVEKILPNQQVKVLKGEGKRKIAAKLQAIIQKEAQNQLRCLILRDLDAHEGETAASIQQSIQQTVRNILEELGYPSPTLLLTPLGTNKNVFTLVVSQPDIRLALHLATHRWHNDFVKTTMDDYVLRLALERETAVSLVQKQNWPHVQPDEIIKKVTVEIPELLRRNQIPLREAKDYIRLYAAVMQLHTSPQVFAEKVLANAPDAQRNSVFASLKAAVDFLGGGNHVV